MRGVARMKSSARPGLRRSSSSFQEEPVSRRPGAACRLRALTVFTRSMASNSRARPGTP